MYSIDERRKIMQPDWSTNGCVCDFFFRSVVVVVCAHCITEQQIGEKATINSEKESFLFVRIQFYFVRCIICWYFDWVCFFIFDVRCNEINVGATKQFVCFFFRHSSCSFSCAGCTVSLHYDLKFGIHCDAISFPCSFVFVHHILTYFSRQCMCRARTERKARGECIWARAREWVGRMWVGVNGSLCIFQFYLV